ncbi:GNAT family N-acetyltransferase [Rhizobium bangladeshense]|uniref:GNAT family N-acetyltransferase n=1 Tax=Rhizobium bangladeshense TaxID=1138189 RepID=UPI0007E54C77|nr:GNAT family N-acetyltransferase [Rhizobium bangladeshense]
MNVAENTSSVAVRPATLDDMETLGMFGAELMSLHHEWDRERFLWVDDMTHVAYAGHLSQALGRPDVIILVAQDHETLVGYAYARMEGFDYMSLRGPAGVIHDIFIDQSRRRNGLGRMLLDAMISALTDRGAKQILLSTAYRNTAAQRLFASAGLRLTMVEMTLNVDR